jgi:hypothetical protein
MTRFHDQGIFLIKTAKKSNQPKALQEQPVSKNSGRHADAVFLNHIPAFSRQIIP